MPAPIAVQLYSIRELLAKTYEPGIRKIADIGYIGVEPAGFPGTTCQAAAKLFNSLNLQVPSAHMALPLGDVKQQVIDDMGTLGSPRLVSGKGPEDFNSIAKIKATCETFNKAYDVLKHNHLQFCLHNHWWEFQPVEGKLVYEVMLEELHPGISFEIDTYWVKTGGCDPVKVLKQFKDRAPLLHIKDGPCQQNQHMTAVGKGTMDFCAIAQAAEKTAQWFIVELDSCATDMMQAVADSYTYLTSQKLAKGNK